jgi:hypothetical protein
MLEIHRTMSSAENLAGRILENNVTSQNYREISDAVKLLEMYEAVIRDKKQLLSLNLRKYYMKQYFELHEKRESSPEIIRG